MIDRRAAIFGTIAAGLSATAAQGQTAPPAVHPGAAVPGLPEPNETIDLWPNGAPGMPAKALVETVDERSKDSALTDRAVYGISRPRMVVFRPAIPNGSALGCAGLVNRGGNVLAIMPHPERDAWNFNHLDRREGEDPLAPSGGAILFRSFVSALS